MFSYIMARTSYIRWNDGDVRFLLDQLVKLDLYSVKQSTGRYVAPLGHIILIPCQPVMHA